MSRPELSGAAARGDPAAPTALRAQVRALRGASPRRARRASPHVERSWHSAVRRGSGCARRVALLARFEHAGDAPESAPPAPAGREDARSGIGSVHRTCSCALAERSSAILGVALPAAEPDPGAALRRRRCSCDCPTARRSPPPPAVRSRSPSARRLPAERSRCRSPRRAGRRDDRAGGSRSASTTGDQPPLGARHRRRRARRDHRPAGRVDATGLRITQLERASPRRSTRRRRRRAAARRRADRADRRAAAHPRGHAALGLRRDRIARPRDAAPRAAPPPAPATLVPGRSTSFGVAFRCRRHRRRLRARARHTARGARALPAGFVAVAAASPARRAAAQPVLSCAKTRKVGSPTGSSPNSGLTQPVSSEREA